MKKIQTVIAWIAFFAFAVSGHSTGFVLCIDHEGHVSLEASQNGSCNHDGHHDDHDHQHGDEESSETDENSIKNQDSGCVDIPILLKSSDFNSEKNVVLSSLNQQIPQPIALGETHVYSPRFEKVTFLYHAPPWVKTTLYFQRKVVLRI